jgi:hypothetical protein
MPARGPVKTARGRPLPTGNPSMEKLTDRMAHASPYGETHNTSFRAAA